MHPARERKCLHCEEFFTPDARNRKRQHYCAKACCRRASKAASQRRRLSQPANTDYFRDADNAARVRAWQAAHPGYWKTRRKKPGVVLQDDCRPQPAEKQEVATPDGGVVLQEDWQRQPPLDEVIAARRQLEAAGVIAYENPLYQVLALEERR